MTIVRPIWVMASSMRPDALILLAVAMLQLKMRAIPAIPYSRFLCFVSGIGATHAAFVSRIRSTSSPTVKSIIRVFGFKFILEDSFHKFLDAIRTTPKEHDSKYCGESDCL